jgi:acyl-CoA reductase-like NAD-dependent aldehyde dehydrogenase
VRLDWSWEETWRGGDHLDGGFFYLPTLFDDVPRDGRIAQEEIFGPVLAVTPFRDQEHAVELANATRYGLIDAVADHPRAAVSAFQNATRGCLVDGQHLGNDLLDAGLPVGTGPSSWRTVHRRPVRTCVR